MLKALVKHINSKNSNITLSKLVRIISNKKKDFLSKEILSAARCVHYE